MFWAILANWVHHNQQDETIEMGQTSKELDTRVASVLLLILQCCCWGGFFTAEYGLFNAAEYEMYIGIALMMLIGFGYLMTFLKAYGLGAVGFTFIITCLSVQMNMFLNSLIPNNGKLVVDAVTLTDGNFAAATVLIRYAGPKALAPRRGTPLAAAISLTSDCHGKPLMRSPCALAPALAAADSYGCILGKSTPLQLVVLTVLESIFFQVCITTKAGSACETPPPARPPARLPHGTRRWKNQS